MPLKFPLACLYLLRSRSPGGSVHGEKANFTGLVLGYIEADILNQVFVGIRVYLI